MRRHGGVATDPCAGARRGRRATRGFDDNRRGALAGSLCALQAGDGLWDDPLHGVHARADMLCVPDFVAFATIAPCVRGCARQRDVHGSGGVASAPGAGGYRPQGHETTLCEICRLALQSSGVLDTYDDIIDQGDVEKL